MRDSCCVLLLAMPLLAVTGTCAVAADLLVAESANSVFHGDEVPNDGDGKWVALCDGGSVTALADVDVTFSPAYDAVIDSDGEMSGRKITVRGCDRPIALVRGLDIQRGPVPTVLRAEVGLTSRAPVDLSWNGGTARVMLERSGESDVWDIRLEHGGVRQTLVRESTGGESLPRVLWAGDLDGDGALDLLLESSPHYNLSNYQLFTSRGRKDGELVRLAAAFARGGC